jgi:fatty acid desaturase
MISNENRNRIAKIAAVLITAIALYYAPTIAGIFSWIASQVVIPIIVVSIVALCAVGVITIGKFVHKTMNDK